ncbi:reverse transcriptase domain-containing protein [Tanacetum coccineum]
MLKTRDGVTDIRRPQRVEDLAGQEKLRYDSDIKAVNILLLGFPVDIYTLINHYQTAKEIGDRVKELMEGTKMTKQERESMRYDELDKFTSEPGESIHSYYLRYTKLINDMKMIPMSMSNMQINTKFVNHLQPEWSRTTCFAGKYLQSTLSYNSQQIQYHTQPSKVYQPYQHHQSNTQITQQLIQSPPLQSYAPTVVQQPPTIQPDTGFVVPTFLPTDDPIASLNKAMIFLNSAYSSRYPPINNQLQTSSNPRTQATIQNGQVTVQNVQGRQSQGYAGNARKNQASGAKVVNLVGNTGANQPRVIRCYNCNGEGHIAKQCTTKKRVNESLTKCNKVNQET